MPEIQQQAVAREVEQARQVAEHESFGFEDPGLDPGRPELGKTPRDVVAMGQGNENLAAPRGAADRRPVEDDVVQVEGGLPLDREGNRGSEFLGIAKRELELVQGDPFSGHGGDHMLDFEMMEFDEALQGFGQPVRGIRARMHAHLAALQPAQGLLQCYGLDRMRADVQPEDALREWHQCFLDLIASASIVERERLSRSGSC